MKMRSARGVVLSLGLLLLGVSLLPGQGTKGDKPDAAVERTRKQTKMLDDLYKTAIVLITEHYVKGDEPAAAVAGKLLWKEMKAKGHHEARLIDATGDPIETVNAPADDFEKAAIKEILGGKASVDKVIEKDGKRYLRTATIVPVVMEKCKSCHPHYANVPQGKAIGAIAYTLPIE